MKKVIQSIRFARKHYTEATADKWIMEHGYIKKPFGKENPQYLNWFSYRQRNPKTLTDYSEIKSADGKMLFVLGRVK
tara:strand:+ start:22 stop:252 length:231 start_codon:yes stop_codon:yes gene_type:complete